MMMSGPLVALVSFVACFVGIPVLFTLARFLGVYTIVRERECRVYVLFGKVLAILDEPGLYFLWAKMGPAALIVNWLGTRYNLDMRLDQEYLRSRSRSCSRTPIRGARSAPTWETPRCDPCRTCRWPRCWRIGTR